MLLEHHVGELNICYLLPHGLNLRLLLLSFYAFYESRLYLSQTRLYLLMLLLLGLQFGLNVSHANSNSVSNMCLNSQPAFDVTFLSALF